MDQSDSTRTTPETLPKVFGTIVTTVVLKLDASWERELVT